MLVEPLVLGRPGGMRVHAMMQMGLGFRVIRVIRTLGSFRETLNDANVSQ